MGSPLAQVLHPELPPDTSACSVWNPIPACRLSPLQSELDTSVSVQLI